MTEDQVLFLMREATCHDEREKTFRKFAEIANGYGWTGTHKHYMVMAKNEAFMAEMCRSFIKENS